MKVCQYDSRYRSFVYSFLNKIQTRTPVISEKLFNDSNIKSRRLTIQVVAATFCRYVVDCGLVVDGDDVGRQKGGS